MLSKAVFFGVIAAFAASLVLVAGSLAFVGYSMLTQPAVQAAPAKPAGSASQSGTPNPAGGQTGQGPAAGQTTPAGKTDTYTGASTAEPAAKTAQPGTATKTSGTTAQKTDTTTSASTAPATQTPTKTTSPSSTTGTTKTATTPDAKTSASTAPATQTTSTGTTSSSTATKTTTDTKTSASTAPAGSSAAGTRLRIDAGEKWYSKPFPYLAISVSGGQASAREREWEGTLTYDGTMTVYATSGGNISTRQVTGSIRGRYEAKLSLSATTADGRVSGSYTYSVKVSNTIRTPDGASYAVDSSTLSSRGSLSGVRQADGSYILSFDGSGQEVWRSATLTSQQRTTTLNGLGQYRATIQ